MNAFACAENSAFDEETLAGAMSTFENLLSGAVFYVHKYACTFIDMYVGIYVCIYMYIYVYTCMYVYIHV